MGNKVISGVNDLETWCKQNNKEYLIDEWDYEKNEVLNPCNVAKTSHQKVWWICSICGFKWQADISNRVNSNNVNNCPECNKAVKTSFPEQAVYYYIKQYFPDTINSDRTILNGKELDIYIPSKKVAIEYDGQSWHQNINRDIKKNQLCKDNNITLIRIREPKLDDIDGCIIFKRTNIHDNMDLSLIITNILKYLNVTNIDVDVDRDNINILEQYATKKHKNSLAACHPEIAKEWHPIKNGILTPDKVDNQSHKKVWWLGKCGHEWKAVIDGRTKKNGSDCPYCNNKKVLKGFNDLATVNSDVVLYWNYDKNSKENIFPNHILPYSNKTVWWKCEKGHEWQAKISSISKGYRCPYCSNQKVLKGFNDLATTNPKLLDEWNYEKNTILPTEICQKSGKKVWWKCSKCGFVWKAQLNNKSNGTGCPKCAKENLGVSIICIEKNLVYSNIRQIMKELNIKDPSSIYKCCKGKQNTAYGYHWKYADEQNII